MLWNVKRSIGGRIFIIQSSEFEKARELASAIPSNPSCQKYKRVEKSPLPLNTADILKE
jgi:hypothetical protein